LTSNPLINLAYYCRGEEILSLRTGASALVAPAVPTPLFPTRQTLWNFLRRNI